MQRTRIPSPSRTYAFVPMLPMEAVDAPFTTQNGSKKCLNTVWLLKLPSPSTKKVFDIPFSVPAVAYTPSPKVNLVYYLVVTK